MTVAKTRQARSRAADRRPAATGAWPRHGVLRRHDPAGLAIVAAVIVNLGSHHRIALDQRALVAL